ncbi:S41 family peptidase [Parapedobacter deserti]|uniref:S41 family peptidase n=1 Tax=Parapedobacter deserti TaxID=1912957 RepID=A0ABV7JQA7_9SPHI
MKYHKHIPSARRATVLVAGLLFFSGFAVIKDDLFLISKNLDIFSAVYRQISLNYVDETDPNTLIKTAVDAMLNELDPYTEYVVEADVEAYKLKYVDTKYGGIGASVFERDGSIFIAELFAGHPAARAGLQPGDELISINGTALRRKSSAAVSQLLRGGENSAIRLMVRKPGREDAELLVLTRAVVRQPNVSYEGLLAEGVGYIKLDKFLEHAAKEVEEALHGLAKEAELKGLILDLRNNGGGIVQEAVKIVNLFVPEGELVVSQKGKNVTKTHSFRTTAKPIALDIPLVVLINRHSASAAEIVAGALQDLDRAVVIGERSFGKGLVQQTFNLPYHNMVKVTVAKYYTPSGRCIQSLDFVHRDSSGEFTRLPDSLINAFSTKKGRVVYDGSGIFPDIAVEKPPYHAITKDLLSKYLVFDYATNFKREHARIPDASNFEIDDMQYADFIRFLEGKNYHYSSRTAEVLRQLVELAEEEKNPDEVLLELRTLAQKVSHSKQQDLINHQKELKEVLGSEIASRYYHRKGRISFSFKHDHQLQRAIALLGTTHNEYYSILAGEGQYKIIGRPEALLAVAETAD